MSHDTIALVLWSILALALVLTVAGVATRQSWLLFVAATLSILFGIAAIFSIGIFILVLAGIQLAAGLSFRRSDNANQLG